MSGKSRLAAFLLIVTTSGYLLATSTTAISLQPQTSSSATKPRQTRSLLFTVDDLKDPAELANQLRTISDPVSEHIMWQASPQTRALLGRYSGSGAPSNELKTALVSELNRVVRGPNIYDARRFALVRLRPETERLVAGVKPQQRTFVHLNRALLEDMYVGLVVTLDPGFVFDDEAESGEGTGSTGQEQAAPQQQEAPQQQAAGQQAADQQATGQQHTGAGAANEQATGNSAGQASGGWTWAGFGKAAIGGAVGGAVAGAVAGSFAGGAGAGPGAVAGGVGGIVGGSVGYVATYLVFGNMIQNKALTLPATMLD